MKRNKWFCVTLEGPAAGCIILDQSGCTRLLFMLLFVLIVYICGILSTKMLDISVWYQWLTHTEEEVAAKEFTLRSLKPNSTSRLDQISVIHNRQRAYISGRCLESISSLQYNSTRIFSSCDVILLNLLLQTKYRKYVHYYNRCYYMGAFHDANDLYVSINAWNVRQL